MDSGRVQAFLLFPRITSYLVWIDFLYFFLLLFFFYFFFLCFLLFIPFDFLRFVLSESNELALEDVSESEISLDHGLDVKELDDDDELPYFRFRDFLVSDLLLPWFALESFVSLDAPAVWAEFQRSEKEAYCTGYLTFSCGVYLSRLFSLFSPFFLLASRSSRFCLTLRGLSIYLLSTIIQTIVSYWFLTTFFENVFILYVQRPKPFFAWKVKAISLSDAILK